MAFLITIPHIDLEGQRSIDHDQCTLLVEGEAHLSILFVAIHHYESGTGTDIEGKRRLIDREYILVAEVEAPDADPIGGKSDEIFGQVIGIAVLQFVFEIMTSPPLSCQLSEAQSQH